MNKHVGVPVIHTLRMGEKSKRHQTLPFKTKK